MLNPQNLPHLPLWCSMHQCSKPIEDIEANKQTNKQANKSLFKDQTFTDACCTNSMGTVDEPAIPKGPKLALNETNHRISFFSFGFCYCLVAMTVKFTD